jgi:hypothetical protein
VLLLGLLLITCGSTSQQPTTLHILRPASDSGLLLPRLERTIHNTNAVQQLYAAALTLPVVNQRIYNCPADFDVVYQLDFLADSSMLRHVNVQASGCEWVYLSSTDIRWTNTAFNRLLAHTIGIPSLLPAPYNN